MGPEAAGCIEGAHGVLSRRTARTGAAMGEHQGCATTLPGGSDILSSIHFRTSAARWCEMFSRIPIG
jgi:hypothetical protein